MGSEVFSHPFDSPVSEHRGLDLVVDHLRGNRIGIYLENASQISVSQWKPGEKMASTYKGRFYIAPVDCRDISVPPAELILSEDLSMDEPPEGYPSLVERTTSSRLFIRSLLYFGDSAVWDVRFKPMSTDVEPIVDGDFEFVREQKFSCHGRGLYNFKPLNM